MAKVNNLDKLNITVDNYTENYDNGILVCETFTPGIANSQATHHVTFTELQSHMCDGNDTIYETPANDAQEIEPVNFWFWYDNNRFSPEMHYILADILNKRQRRTTFTMHHATTEKKVLHSLTPPHNHA